MTPQHPAAPEGGVWPKGRLVDHPQPGKVWVQVPHRNELGSDWIEVDTTPAAPETETDANGLTEAEREVLADLCEAEAPNGPGRPAPSPPRLPTRRRGGYDGWHRGFAFCLCGSSFESMQDFESHVGMTTTEPSEVAETTAGERAVEALAKVLAGHRSVFQCDGDYGEMQWVECTCGSDYYVDTDAGCAEHEAHLATVLAARVSAAETKARADERERIAQAIEDACPHPPRVGGWCPDCGSAASIARGDAR